MTSLRKQSCPTPGEDRRTAVQDRTVPGQEEYARQGQGSYGRLQAGVQQPPLHSSYVHKPRHTNIPYWLYAEAGAKRAEASPW